MGKKKVWTDSEQWPIFLSQKGKKKSRKSGTGHEYLEPARDQFEKGSEKCIPPSLARG